jgi:hypothetical protein
VSAPLTNLTPNRTYHYRIKVQSAKQTVYGDDATFFIGKPSAAPWPAGSIDATTATLTGAVNPNLVDTTYHFEYGPTTAYGTSTAEQALGAGSQVIAVTTPVTDLTPATTYHFRVVATNADGITRSSDATFRTSAAPLITKPKLVGLGGGSLTASASVNPGGIATTAWVAYGATSSYDSTTTQQDLGASVTAVSASVTLNGLAPGVYHYAWFAQNSVGTTSTPDATFTIHAPAVTNVVASKSTSSSARITAKITPNLSPTTYSVLYGTTSAYDSQSTTASAGAGPTAVGITVSLGGLAPSTTYHYAIAAVNDVGTTQSPDQTFRTRANGLIVGLPLGLVPLSPDRPTSVGVAAPSRARRVLRF